MKPKSKEKFLSRVLPSTPFGNIPQRFPALQGTAGALYNAQLPRIPAPWCRSSPPPPHFAPSLRWQVADAKLNKNREKYFKTPKPYSSLKRHKCPIKPRCEARGERWPLQLGALPGNVSRFPPGRDGQPHAYSYLQGLPSPPGDRSRMEQRLGRRLPSGSLVQRRAQPGAGAPAPLTHLFSLESTARLLRAEGLWEPLPQSALPGSPARLLSLPP